MKELKQLGIILSILFVGQIIQKVFQLIIPGTVIGMIILLILLMSNIIKMEWIESVSNILLGHLLFLFIPGGVGIIKSLDMFKGNILSLLFILITTTVIVTVVTGITVQLLIKDGGKSID